MTGLPGPEHWELIRRLLEQAAEHGRRAEESLEVARARQRELEEVVQRLKRSAR